MLQSKGKDMEEISSTGYRRNDYDGSKTAGVLSTYRENTLSYVVLKLSKGHSMENSNSV